MTRKQKYDAYRLKLKKWFIGNGDGNAFIYKFSIYALLTIIGFIFLYPLFYMVSLSFKNLNDLLDASVIWVPRTFYLENYRIALSVMGLPRDFAAFLTFNTLYRTIVVVGIPAVAATLATTVIGYGFARFRFPLKKFWLVAIVATFIVPSQIILLPQFVWFNNQLGILKTLWSYILPAVSGQGLNAAVFILIFYSFFQMIPKALDEAAYMDGANEFKVFYHIGLKLSIQPIIIVFLFNFVWYWNDFYRASYFLSGSKWTTLPLELSKFENTYRTMMEASEAQMIDIYEPLIMAGTILTVLPLLILYFGLQRYFVESIDRTGITGE